MKTSSLKILILLLSGMCFFSLPSYGGEKDSTYSIEVTGKVLIPDWDLAKTYKIELIHHNTVIDSGLVVDEENFLMRVERNSLYTIRISKVGYTPLVLTVDTRVSHKSDGSEYNFDQPYFITLYGFQMSLAMKTENQ